SGARISDFTATDLEQLQLLMDLEISTLEPGEEVIVVAGNIKQT
ncbi:methylhydantoinase, partial [Enterococcus durans]